MSGLPWRRIAMVIAVLAGTALAVKVLVDSSDELFAAGDYLGNVQPSWVALAVGAEIVCYLARGATQRRLLVSAVAEDPNRPEPDPRTGRPAPRAGPVVLAATTLAGDAVAYCLPFGFAAAGVVTLRILRRRSISEVLAGWMFAVATALYVAMLAVLAIIAAELAGANGPAGLQSVSIVLLAVLGVVLALFFALRWTPSGATTARLVRPVHRLRARSRVAVRRFVRNTPSEGRHRRIGPWFKRVCANALRALGRWWSELRHLRLTPIALGLAAAGMLVSWLADIGVLALSYVALGATPPWAGLLLAYCAGQVASSVPITPGGIGVVEGSLTLALVAFGGSTEITLAAVLLYRLISHWACVPAGGIAWAALRWSAHRADSARLAGTAPPVAAGEAVP